MFPFAVVIQRISRHVEAHIFGQFYRKLFFRHRHDAAALAMHHRNWAAPIALARNQPIAQTKIHRANAVARCFDAAQGFGLGSLDIQPVQEARIGQPPWPNIGLLTDFIARRIGVRRNDDRQHGQSIFASKVEVALIVRRTAEDRARAVTHQHEISDIDRQFPSGIERMHRLDAGIETAFFRRLDRFLGGSQPPALGDEFGKLGIALGKGGGQRMIRRKRHEACAEQRIGPRRKNIHCGMGRTFQKKFEPHAFGTADPVFLHQPDFLRPASQSIERT